MTSYADVLKALTKANKGHIHRNASHALVEHRPHITTGIFELDRMLLGGLAEGTITEIVGQEGSSKTTIAERVIAGAQKSYPDKKAVFIDLEGVRDAAWGALHGVDNDALLYFRPDLGDDGADLADELIRANDISVIVFDSIAAAQPSKELEKSVSDAIVANQAVLIGKLMRRTSAAIAAARNEGRFISLLALNQFRSKIAAQGDTRSRPGGNASKFFASHTVYLRGTKVKVKVDGDEINDRIEVVATLNKTKIGQSITEAEWKMALNPAFPYGLGTVVNAPAVLNYADSVGLTSGVAASWKLGRFSDKTFRKKEDRMLALMDDPDLERAIWDASISHWRQRMGKGDGPWKAGTL